MERFNVDELFLLALELDLSSIINFCKSSKKVNEKICHNERFWRVKVNKDFPGFINRQETFREQYVFLTKILTRERFEQMLEKPKIFSKYYTGFLQFPLDLFDLLYNKISSDYWGVIDYEIDYSNQTLREFDVIYEILLVEHDDYKEFKLARVQSFLNEKDYLDLVDWNFIEEGFPQVAHNNTYENFVSSLKTFEKRFQQYIIEHTFEDVRKEIEDYQEKKLTISGKVFLDALYDDEEIEFLQILHDAIRSKKLDIFDPLDYDLIMNKLRR